MKDIWELCGTGKYEGWERVKWCETCDEERESHHEFCYECASELTKALRGPEMDISSQYEKPPFHRVK